MGTRFRALSVMSLLVLLFVVAAPVRADSPIDVEGHWTYYVFDLEVREEGCATFMVTYDLSYWSGGFEAATIDRGQVGINCSGLATYRAQNYFTGVTIDGKSGDFVMAVEGRQPVGEIWRGQWEIISASGELEGMYGSGTWWGPGAGGPFVWGHLDYAGTVAFD